jgi:uncharacterized protein (UPF0371 family)
MKRGFDTKKYLTIQSQEVFARIKKFDRLYLEFGGINSKRGYKIKLKTYIFIEKLKIIQNLQNMH